MGDSVRCSGINFVLSISRVNFFNIGNRDKKTKYHFQIYFLLTVIHRSQDFQIDQQIPTPRCPKELYCACSSTSSPNLQGPPQTTAPRVIEKEIFCPPIPVIIILSILLHFLINLFNNPILRF